MSRDHTWTMGSLCEKWFWRGFFSGVLGLLAIEFFVIALWQVFTS